MKIKDIIEEIPEGKRKKVVDTICACMKNINCEQVDWKEFMVYASSTEKLQKILENLSIEFLLPIAEKAREEMERKIIIFCHSSREKNDEIWFVHVNATEIHANINLSAKTMSYLSKSEDK